MKIAPDGSINLQCLNLPEWLRKEFPQSVPLNYSLKSQNLMTKAAGVPSRVNWICLRSLFECALG